MHMIHVIASVRVKPGKRAKFLDVFKANLPMVRREQGCIRYLPAVDIDAALPKQVFDADVVTIIETWESLDALRDHLATSHIAAYRERVREIVEETTLKILQEV